MSRLVKLAPAQTAGVGALVSDSDQDSYVTRIGKYVPAEIMALYLPLMNVLNQATPSETPTVRMLAYGICFGIFAVLTPIYFSKVAKPGDAVGTQRIVSTIAFVIWAYSLGGIFKELNIHREWIAGAVVFMFTAISGAIIPRKAA